MLDLGLEQCLESFRPWQTGPFSHFEVPLQGTKKGRGIEAACMLSLFVCGLART